MEPASRAKKRKRKSKLQDGNYLVYAVSKGLNTGIFKNWLTCSKSVIGHKGSSYKGFSNLEDAKQYLVESGTVVSFNDCNESDFVRPESRLSSTDDDISIGSKSCESLQSKMDDPVMEDLKTVCDATNIIPKLHCNSCNKVLDCVNMLVNKIELLEATIKRQGDQIECLKSELLTSGISLVKKNSTITLECKNPIKQTYANKISASTNKPQMVSSLRNNTMTDSLPISHSKSKPSPRKTNRPAFCWDKCLVLDVTSDKQVSKDDIRVSICREFGATDIELINPYRNSELKRYMVQVPDDDKRQKIVSNWNHSLFGESNVRHTVKRCNDTLVIPNVPLDFDTDSVLLDLNAAGLRAIAVKRLYNRHKLPLRAVCVQFQSEREMNSALNLGKIGFPSMHNIILHFKQYVRRKFSSPMPVDHANLNDEMFSPYD